MNTYFACRGRGLLANCVIALAASGILPGGCFFIEIFLGRCILVAANPKKQAVVKELVEKLSQAKGAVIINYRGITVSQDTKLRRKLREAGVEYHVVKNTMTRLAAHELGITGLDTYLEGPSAIAVSTVDPVAPAKIISEFAKELKIIEIKAGLLEDKVIDADEVKELANLPSREVLLAKLLGTLNAPITGFVNVLAGNIRNLVYVLEAVRKQKESA